MGPDLAETIRELEQGIDLSTRVAFKKINEQWEMPIAERVKRGRALGPLTVYGVQRFQPERKQGEACHLLLFEAPDEDFAAFSEGQGVRLSQDDPKEQYRLVHFIGMVDEYLAVRLTPDQAGAFSGGGWTLDEDFVDLSDFHRKALAQLGETEHGRERVFPVLFGEEEPEVDFEQEEEIRSQGPQLAGKGGYEPDEVQIDAIAEVAASTNFALIQGPPGTGKTFSLACAVLQMVRAGERVLVTGLTHRAIHNALKAIHEMVGEQCPVIKISQAMPLEEDEHFGLFPGFEMAKLSPDGPWVIGATPYALFSKRMQGVEVDRAVIDETSQMSMMTAVMVMLESRNWSFFGDPRQLPPVNLLDDSHLVSQSVFGLLEKKAEPLMLRHTYRMNEEITRWTSECFYQGNLVSKVADARLALKREPLQYRDFLDPDFSLVRCEVKTRRPCRSVNKAEAELAIGVVDELMASGLEAAEIGVVTPFRAQVGRVRSLARKRLGDEGRGLLVDTVDRFQGQEREVIVISMVSSRAEFITRLLDFLLQENRLNVAVTRARTKVILLHSPELGGVAAEQRMSSDHASAFCSLMEACHEVQSTGDSDG